MPGIRRGLCLKVDDDLAPRVAVLHVPDGRGHLAQRVGPVDDRCHLAGLDEFGERLQVLRAFSEQMSVVSVWLVNGESIRARS